MVNIIYSIDRLFIIGGLLWRRDNDHGVLPRAVIEFLVPLPNIIHTPIGKLEDHSLPEETVDMRTVKFVFKLGAYKVISPKTIQAEYHLVEVK